MTTSERWSLEADLAVLLGTHPGRDGVAQLDERVGRALATWSAAGGSTARSRRPRRRVTIIGLLAAALVAGGAGGALGLYDGMGAGFDYGFSIELARSVPIGATAVDHGYRVTIDRAYLDGGRLMLAVRVQDERERPEVAQLMAMYSVVTDDQGVWAGAGVATSRPLGPWVATNIQWRLPPGPLPAGTHRLHVEVPHIFWYDATLPLPSGEDPTWDPWRKQEGAWSFDIEVPVDGGATDIRIRPDIAVEVGNRPFRIEEVVIGRSAVRLRLTYDDPGATWTLVGELRHDGTTYPFVLQSLGEPGVVEIQTDGGTDSPSGTWSVVITRADRQVADEPERSVSGPWQVDLEVP
jgi:hypothetical protein